MPACPGYHLKQRLGEGGFGVVHLAERAKDKKEFAVKIIKHLQRSVDQRLLQDEIAALRRVSHPHIVALKEVVQIRQHHFIVMEYCSGGDLRRLLDYYIDAGIDMPESRIRSVLYQLVLALHHCHHSYFGGWTLLHRDIKPENVLFDAQGVVKLGDFGLSRLLEGPQVQADSFVGTRGYLAPEIILGSGYDAKADMYSLGCLLMEMCTLTPPHIGPGSWVICKFPDLALAYSVELMNLLRSLLHEEPAARPSTGDVLSHRCFAAWVQSLNNGERLRREALSMKEEELRAKELSLKSRARELDAREASLESQMRRLAFRASASPPPTTPKKALKKSPSPFKTP